MLSKFVVLAVSAVFFHFCGSFVQKFNGPKIYGSLAYLLPCL